MTEFVVNTLIEAASVAVERGDRLLTASYLQYDIEQRASEVLDFWFGGDQQVNYRTKWFPEGSSTQQAATDLEIHTRFAGLLSEAVEGKLSSWELDPMACVALIVVLDQFSRHIFRYLELPAGHERRLEADSLALVIAKRFQERCSLVMSLPMAEFVFSLMPLRHTPSIEHLRYILQRLEDKEHSNSKAEELMQRFRKQTIRRLQQLEDRERLEATDDILERHAFQADESDIMDHPLVKTTEAFLRQHLLKDQSAVKTKNGKGVQKPKKPKPAHGVKGDIAEEEDNSPLNVLMISLSGGVDSMVISKILALLKHHHRLPIHAIVSIHIDYGNRPEAHAEANYVEQWSHVLEITPKVRSITEATRGVTERDLYEKLTRTIRYGYYIEVMESAAKGEFTQSVGSNRVVNISGMIFGHHQGDVQENVVSNVMRGSSPLDLSGMTEVSVANNVIVWRPLLQHSKDEIYDFAHKYGVPYFKDSTPSWSTRGKLRNHLIPLLREIYGEGCLRNLSMLAQESDEIHELVHQNLYNPFLQAVRKYHCGIVVNISPFVSQPQVFWRESLKLLMHSMGMSMVRDKAVGNFVERIQRPHPHRSNSTGKGGLLPGWLELRKGFHTYLSEEGDLYIIRDGILRSNLVVYNPATTKNQLKQSGRDGGSDDHSSLDSQEMFKVHFAQQLSDSSQVQALLDGKVEEIEFSDGSNCIVSCDGAKLEEVNERDFDMSIVSNSASENATTSQSVLLGPWRVTLTTIKLTRADPTPIKSTKKEPCLKFIGDILDGGFAYSLTWPVAISAEDSSVELDLVLLVDIIKHLESTLGGTVSIRVYDYAVEDVSDRDMVLAVNALQALSVDMKNMDLRLRDGLPHLVPLSSSRQASSSLASPTNAKLVMQVAFDYVGSTAHHGH